MWQIDNRSIAPPSKTHKSPENIWFFKTRVNTVNTYAPQISSTDSKFYKSDVVAQVNDVSYPKIVFFHCFWLKGHEKLSCTTKLERV